MKDILPHEFERFRTICTRISGYIEAKRQRRRLHFIIQSKARPQLGWEAGHRKRDGNRGLRTRSGAELWIVVHDVFVRNSAFMLLKTAVSTPAN